MHQWETDETAVAWDVQGGGELPTRAKQQDLLLALLAASEIGDGAVLDLGIGSGLVAEAVLQALPDAQLFGIDFSNAMLDLARERLSPFGSRVLLRSHDLSDPDAIDLPPLRYKAAFSIQTRPREGRRAAVSGLGRRLAPRRLEDPADVRQSRRRVDASRRPARAAAGPAGMDDGGRPRRMLPAPLRQPCRTRRSKAPLRRDRPGRRAAAALRL